MNSTELLAFFDNVTRKMRTTMEQKNADYAGASPDAFANFSRVEVIGIASTEQGFLTRMFDKFCRITSFVKLGTLRVADETVEDTLLDLANYAILMAAYIKSKRQAHNMKACADTAIGSTRRVPRMEGDPHAPNGLG